MPDLALNHAACAEQRVTFALDRRGDIEQVGGRSDRAERIAQLVAQHGQELVLGAALRLQRLFGALALEQIVAHFVLTAACPQRRLHAAVQRHHPDRPLEQRDVAQLVEPLQVRRGGLGHAPTRGHDDDRDVGPGRLMIERGHEVAHRARRQRLFREHHRAHGARQASDDVGNTPAALRIETGRAQRGGQHLGIASERREDQDLVDAIVRVSDCRGPVRACRRRNRARP